MIKNGFYSIREFACKNFYVWDNGEDFDWLRREWKKFEPMLKSEIDVEDFILTLADIYNSFCQESYFETINEEDAKKYDCIIDDTEQNVETPESQEYKERIQNYFNQTLDILLEVYKRPEEVLRQFATIAIDFQLPHNDGYKYVFNLFKSKWNYDKYLAKLFQDFPSLYIGNCENEIPTGC